LPHPNHCKHDAIADLEAKKRWKPNENGLFHKLRFFVREELVAGLSKTYAVAKKYYEIISMPSQAGNCFVIFNLQGLPVCCKHQDDRADMPYFIGSLGREGLNGSP